MKILILAPHPDDEVLGCGGTIAKYVARGDKVSICYITTAYLPEWSENDIQTKQIEINSSNAILGINESFFLKFPTVKLDTIPQKDINASISCVVTRILPDYVFIPHRGDLNMDHRIVHDAALVALRPIHHHCTMICSYETLSETEWGQPIAQFIPNSYCDISDYFSKKIEALKAYHTELKPFPHPRSIDAIESLAKKRGSEVGIYYAEAFSVIRDIF